jgi:hypothetical protein
MRERGMATGPEVEGWSPEDFDKANLPMIVACRVCETTMAFPSCMIMDEDILCRGCCP